MLKTVIDLKGAKRFKPYKVAANDHGKTFADLEMNDMDSDQAKRLFRESMRKSAYNTTFGDRPKEAASVFQKGNVPAVYKQLSSILKPQIAGYVEKWLGINNQEEFSKRIMATLREMYTVIRN